MTPSSRLTSAASSCWRRSGPQSTSTRSSPLSTRIEDRSRRFRGSSGSQRPQSFPIFGTPVEVPQPRILSFTRRLVEKFEKVRSRRLGKLLGIFGPQVRNEAGGVRDESRLTFTAPVRDGREERRVRLDQHLVGGQPFGRLLQIARILERHDPGERN